MRLARAFAACGLALALSLSLGAGLVPLSALAQTTPVPPPPKPVCALRTSVLESYGPFATALPAGRAAAAHTTASAQAETDYARFDTALAATIAATAPGGEATLALVDLERLIDTLDACGQKLGWGTVMGQSRPALYAALQRNRKSLTDPVYAQRLLRSATAQAVLRDAGQGSVVDAAATQAAREKEERAVRMAQEAKERWAAFERSEADRLVREEQIRRGWRSNASAPPASANICDSHGVIAYASQAKDNNWLNLMDTEARSGCLRINDRRDGAFFAGLALGTEVTDEQLAHAAGQLFLCFSNSQARRYFDAAASVARANTQLLGLDIFSMGLTPVWTETTDAAGRRVVTIQCRADASMLGMDMTAMARELGGDQINFVRFELTGNRLRSVRHRVARSNTVSSQRGRDWATGTEGTTDTCDASLASAAKIGGDWTRQGWAVSQRLPYRFTNSNGVQRSDQWVVLRRGTLSADIWNVSYSAPVLGENGNCFGGIVEHFVTLTAERPARIKAGVPLSF